MALGTLFALFPGSRRRPIDPTSLATAAGKTPSSDPSENGTEETVSRRNGQAPESDSEPGDGELVSGESGSDESLDAEPASAESTSAESASAESASAESASAETDTDEDDDESVGARG